MSRRDGRRRSDLEMRRAPRRPRLKSTPGGVFFGFGVLAPIALVVGGIYCLVHEVVLLRIPRGRFITVAGSVADGLGIFALGLAALLHFAVFWCYFPTARRVGLAGVFAGGLAMLVGFVMLLVG